MNYISGHYNAWDDDDEDHFNGQIDESHVYLKGLCETCKHKNN